MEKWQIQIYYDILRLLNDWENIQIKLKLIYSSETLMNE